MRSLSRIDANDLHPEITDSRAVEEVNRGNREMFEILVRRYNGQLFRVGLGYLKQREQVEDAMQNTYLKSFLHLGNYSGDSSFSRWLTRIMFNECLMILRRQRGRREETLVEEVNAQEPAANPQGAAHVTLQEMKVQLEKAIAALPRNLRTAYVLREVQHMTTAEAAACLGITTGGVKVLLFRARERLKATLLSSAAGLELFEYRAQFCDPFTARIMGVVLESR